jgi:hypothetical protein
VGGASNASAQAPQPSTPSAYLVSTKSLHYTASVGVRYPFGE